MPKGLLAAVASVAEGSRTDAAEDTAVERIAADREEASAAKTRRDHQIIS